MHAVTWQVVEAGLERAWGGVEDAVMAGQQRAAQRWEGEGASATFCLLRSECGANRPKRKHAYGRS